MAVVAFAWLGGFRGCITHAVYFRGFPCLTMAVVVFAWLGGFRGCFGRPCAVPWLALAGADSRDSSVGNFVGFLGTLSWCPLSIGGLFFRLFSLRFFRLASFR